MLFVGSEELVTRDAVVIKQLDGRDHAGVDELIHRVEIAVQKRGNLGGTQISLGRELLESAGGGHV